MPKRNKPSRAGVAFFDTQADRLSKLYGCKQSHFDRLRLFTERIGRIVPQGGAILDFGCGPGVMSVALAESGYRVVGLDAAPNMIEFALAEAERAGNTNATFRVIDGDDRALGASQYDAILCSSVIEFVEDESTLLDSLAAALVPGGTLFISVPNGRSVIGAARDWAGRILHLDKLPGRRYRRHSLRTYSVSRLSMALRSAGLELMSRTYFESPIPGRIGVGLSRLSLLGTMMLFVARKPDPVEDGCDPRPSEVESFQQARVIR
ncbi:MAG: methyltransferase domain-containing protein [Phycisphaerales bacterium]|nr:methyltransferase domain-containing protein [Phycisphaerales bacterium]